MRLENIVDIDMYLFIEKGLKGGISYIAKRYSKANNKYMKNYDPKKPSKFITYLDMNDLYSWTMSGITQWLFIRTRSISIDMLSDYCKKIAYEYKIKVVDVKI